MNNGHEVYRTDEEVIKALFQTGGNIKETARILKLSSVHMLRARIRKDPDLKEALAEAREQLNDDAEGVIARAIRGRNKQQAIDAAKWYLPRKAKDRGYGDVVRNENVNLNYDLSKMPLEKRIELLEAINGARADDD